MIGLALILSIAAAVIALLKRGRYNKQVFVLVALTVITLAVTMHFTNHKDANNPFASIGPAILGSLIATILSVSALAISFIKK
jgi:nicotinamide riboside transporter PnuC